MLVSLSAQWSVTERKEEASAVSFPLQNHKTGPVRQERGFLCLTWYTDSLKGQCLLVSLHFRSNFFSHAWMPQTLQSNATLRSFNTHNFCLNMSQVKNISPSTILSTMLSLSNLELMIRKKIKIIIYRELHQALWLTTTHFTFKQKWWKASVNSLSFEMLFKVDCSVGLNVAANFTRIQKSWHLKSHEDRGEYLWVSGLAQSNVCYNLATMQRGRRAPSKTNECKHIWD